MQTEQTTFLKSPFEEPSDQAISNLLGGVPVLSYRPEDLPGFSADRNVPHTSPLIERATALSSLMMHFLSSQQVSSFCVQNGIKNIEWNNSDLLEDVDQRTAGCHTFYYNDTVAFILLRRRSNLLSIRRNLTNSTTIPDEYLANTRTDENGKRTLSYLHSAETQEKVLDCLHEVGHAYAAINKIDFGTGDEAKFEEELFCDYRGLIEFLSAGGDREKIRETIMYRALSGFLDQPHKYFLAPSLSAAFNNEAMPHFHDIRLAYFELRMRVFHAQNTHSSALYHIPSRVLTQTISEVGRNLPPTIPDLYHVCKDLWNPSEYNQYEWFRSSLLSGSMFAELQSVLNLVDLPEVTRKAGQQILDSAIQICPSLVPNPRDQNMSLLDLFPL